MIKNRIPLLSGILCLFWQGCTTQKIIVHPWETNSSRAEVTLNEKKLLSWVTYKKFYAVLGKNGVSSRKKEGDGKTPVGIFTLGTLFGKTSPTTNYPFLPLHSDLLCVDDSESPYYNQIIDKTSLTSIPQSFEVMARNDGLYDLGLVINYNQKGEKGEGSCIFLHIAHNNFSPTAGCVALSSDDVTTIAQWLESDAHPIIEIMP